MKTTRGRWFVDTESMILSYENGRTMRIFTIPPGGNITPSEALAWIAGPDRAAWLPDDDLRDLTRALGDLFGLSQLFPLPELWTRVRSAVPASERIHRLP